MTKLHDHRCARAAILFAVALCAAMATVGTSVASACPRADAGPRAQGPAGAAFSVRCLVNTERRLHGLVPVRSARSLSGAATRHSHAMVATGVFGHTVPGESPLAVRVRRTGYLAGGRRWSLGETIAYGSGEHASPRSLMRSFMNSPPHRAIILSPQFREFGIGLTIGVPGARRTGATLTLDFGQVARG